MLRYMCVCYQIHKIERKAKQYSYISQIHANHTIYTLDMYISMYMKY